MSADQPQPSAANPAGNPVNVALANSWIVINTGGEPTDDKPTVTLETPRDPDRSAAFSISASPFLPPPTVM
jgi:hypothetical protein